MDPTLKKHMDLALNPLHMYQLGELADALLKAQTALRQLAAEPKNKSTAQMASTVLAEIDASPATCPDRIKNLAEEFWSQRAARPKDGG